MSRETVVCTASMPGLPQRLGDLGLRRERPLLDEPEDRALPLELVHASTSWRTARPLLELAGSDGQRRSECGSSPDRRCRRGRRARRPPGRPRRPAGRRRARAGARGREAAGNTSRGQRSPSRAPPRAVRRSARRRRRRRPRTRPGCRRTCSRGRRARSRRPRRRRRAARRSAGRSRAPWRARRRPAGRRSARSRRTCRCGPTPVCTSSKTSSAPSSSASVRGRLEELGGGRVHAALALDRARSGSRPCPAARRRRATRRRSASRR